MWWLLSLLVGTAVCLDVSNINLLQKAENQEQTVQRVLLSTDDDDGGVSAGKIVILAVIGLWVVSCLLLVACFSYQWTSRQTDPHKEEEWAQQQRMGKRRIQ